MGNRFRGRQPTEDDVIRALIGPPLQQDPPKLTGASSAVSSPGGEGGMPNPMSTIGQMITSGEAGAPKPIGPATEEGMVPTSGVGPDFEVTFQLPALLIQDEGVDLGRAQTLDFVGAGVIATIAGDVVTVTITGGGGGGGTPLIVQNNDTAAVAAADVMDFSSSFDVTESPAGEANITLDFAGTGVSIQPARSDHNHDADYADIALEHDPVTVTDTSTIDLTLTDQDISAAFTGVYVSGAAPSSPAAGNIITYAKTNNRLYMKDESGVEIPVHDEYNAFEFVIGGGSGAITAGLYTDFFVPYDCTVIGWTVLANLSSTLTFDLWKVTYAGYPGSVADTITGTDKPRTSASRKGQSTALTGWTTTFNRQDVIHINVDANDNATRALLVIEVRKR
jgi:hypothetical protein